MGGQTGQDPAMQQLQAEQQRKELAKALQTSMQGIGAAVARPMPGYQPYQAGQSGMAGAAQMPGYGAGAVPDIGALIGSLFGSAGGGISEEELARILAGLGYR